MVRVGDVSRSLNERVRNEHLGTKTALIDRSRATIEMLWIEMRRSVCLWMFPFLVAALCWMVYDGLPTGIWLWPQTVASLQVSIVLYGPLVGGLAAWVAGREYRRGLKGFLSTTSRPEADRDFALWGATAVWCGLVYGITVAVFFLLTYLNATWGTPAVWPIAVGLLSIASHTALGYAVGLYLPSRFTAPLYAVVIFWLQSILGLRDWKSPVHNLLTVGDYSGIATVFYKQTINFYAPQSLWLLGLTAAMLATIAVIRQRSTVAFTALALAAAVTIFGAALLLRMPPPALAHEQEAPVRYEPICKVGRIPVCVHTAYKSVLPETITLVDELTRPLAGLPNAPKRAEQRGENSNPARLLKNGTLVFDLRGGFDRGNASMGVSFQNYVGGDIASALVTEPSGFGYLEGPQLVVAGWLLWQTCPYESVISEPFHNATGGGFISPKVEDAIERFDALNPAERSKWLEENYTDLRAGKLTLRDLP
ncbi:hypothetical protein BH23ACT11_BH23ACT11_19100 [soil metagenome]